MDDLKLDIPPGFAVDFFATEGGPFWCSSICSWTQFYTPLKIDMETHISCFLINGHFRNLNWTFHIYPYIYISSGKLT